MEMTLSPERLRKRDAHGRSAAKSWNELQEGIASKVGAAGLGR